jgi:putative transposase
VHARLRHQGIRCGRKRVARRLRAQRLCAARARHHKPRTTESQHRQPVAPNLRGRNFAARAPTRKWVAAIPGIPPRSGWLYLAGIRDAYSRRALGSAMDVSRDERLVEAAWDMALASRPPRAGLLQHSDRGSPYTATAYWGLLDCYGIIMRMSGKGEPYDNALRESCFATRKVEGVQRHDFQTPAPARACIFAYLAVFYNRPRLHSALGYRTPMAFEHLPIVT